MKKIYKKPLIMVEELTLDQPIASNCDAERPIMESMIDMGYFGLGKACDFLLFEKPGFTGLWQDTNMNGILDDNDDEWGDTICYHSAVQTAFLS